MRVCVVGAGAIGGWVGARLAQSDGVEVSAIARGATLAALAEHGWRLQTKDGVIRAPVHAAEHAGVLGEQDLVVVAVKAQAMTEVAAGLAPLLGADTVVLPLMNGVPWWFGTGSTWADEPLRSVDPDGSIAAAIALDRVLGGVVHAACATPEPGLVRHVNGNKLIIGEARGGASPRADRVGALLRGAGFDVTVTPDVRHEIWYKLWGNMTMNPVSAVTGATIDRILDDPLVREFCSAAMREAAAIGAHIGCAVQERPEERHAVTARLGAFKTSMLQDVEAGRQLELDALVAAVHEIGGRVGEPTPNIGALLGLSRLFARVRGLYPAQ